MTKRIFVAVIVLLAGGSFQLCGCGDSQTVPADAPDGHTDMEDGVPHMPGKDNPDANCTGCHGQDLSGGDDGEPSCYSCHGQEW